MESIEHSCTLYNASAIISKKWTLLIILAIYKGKAEKKRYSEIKRMLGGVTPKILSLRLRELEQEGIIRKEIDSSTVPIKTFYSLTDCGRDLLKIIRQIKRWGLDWKYRSKQCRDTACRYCDKAI